MRKFLTTRARRQHYCRPVSPTRIRSSRFLLALTVASLAPFIAMHTASAQTVNWTGAGTGGDGNWGNASDWSPTVVPGSSDDAGVNVVNSSNFSITLDINSYTGNLSDETIGSFTSSGGGDFFLNGTTLLATSFTMSGSGTATITSGTLNLEGGTLTTDSTFTLSGGVLDDLVVADASQLAFVANTSNAFINVTLHGTALNLYNANSNAFLEVVGNLAHTNGMTFNIGSGSSNGFLQFDSTAGNVNPTFDNAVITLGAGGSNGFIGFGSNFGTGSGQGTLLTFGSGTTLQGTGVIGYNAANGAGIVSNGTVNADNASRTLTLQTSGPGNITSGGTMESTANSSQLTITPGTGGVFINNGTLAASGGGVVNLLGATTTLGTVTASGTGSVVNLEGSYNGNQFGAISTSGGGVIQLNGGTITGGTIANVSTLGYAFNSGNTLDNVTLGGGAGLTLINNAFVSIADSFGFTTRATFNLGTNGSSGFLLFDSTAGNMNPTFAAANVTLGGSGGNGYLGFGTGFASGSTLTFGGETTIQGTGVIGYNAANGANLVSNDLINANNASGTLTVQTSGPGNITNGGMMESTASNSQLTITPGAGGAFVNNGTLAAAGGGVVNLLGTTSNLGTVTSSGTGSIINLEGSYSGTQFEAISTSGGGVIQLNGGTITGGTLANVGTLGYTFNGANTLDNVTLGGGAGLTLSNNAYVNIAGSLGFTSGAAFNLGTNGTSGFLVFDSTAGTSNPTLNNAAVTLGSGGSNGFLGFGTGYASGSTLTFGSETTIQGTGQIGYNAANGANLVLNGPINANNASGTLTIQTAGSGNVTNGSTMESTASNSQLNITPGAGGVFINNGTLSATGGGVVNLLGTTSTLGTVTASGTGSVVNLEGSYNGNQFGAISTSGAGVIQLNGGTITGGSIANVSTLGYTFNGGNTLDNVTLGGGAGLTLNNNAYVGISDSFGFTPDAAFNLGTNGSNGFLVFNSTAANVNPTFDAANVTLGSSSGSNGFLGYGTGYASGCTLTFGSETTIQGTGQIGYNAANGANLVLNGTVNADNTNGTLTALTSGSGNITNGGMMESTASNSQLTISPGPTASFNNNGTVLAKSAGNVTINSGAFVNAGTLDLEATSTVSLNATSSTQTSGTTVVNGALTISNSGSNTYNLTGGALYGTGTITGNLTNSGAKVGAGIIGLPTTGTLTETGNYTQNLSGIFSAAIGGAAQGSGYDFFTVSGTTALGGSLDIDMVNGFNPTVGETFQIISDTGTIGTFANAANGSDIADDQNKDLFLVTYAGNGVSLKFVGADNMPEPGAANLVLIVGLPGALGLLARRRRTNSRTQA